MSVTWESANILIGDYVRIDGLKSAHLLNGMRGVVISLHEARQRVGVHTQDGARRLIRPMNLIVLTSVECYPDFVGHPPMPKLLADVHCKYLYAMHLRDHLSQPSEFQTRRIARYNRLDLSVSGSSVAGAGRGVFATCAISAGTVITQYSGCFVDAGRITASNYCLWGDDKVCIEGDPFLDAGCGIGQLINDSSSLGVDDLAQLEERAREYISSARMCNVGMTFKSSEHCVVAVAAIDIPAGAELFYHYGLSSWLTPLHTMCLLMHDMNMARKIEHIWDELASVEQEFVKTLGASVFLSDTIIRFPNIAVVEGHLVNKITGHAATMDECRQVCVFRFGRVGIFCGVERPDLVVIAMLYLVNQMEIKLNRLNAFPALTALATVFYTHGVQLSSRNLPLELSKIVTLEAHQIDNIIKDFKLEDSCQGDGSASCCSRVLNRSSLNSLD